MNAMLVTVGRNQVESVTIDCSLIFTRYLDAMVFDDEDLQRILQQHLTNGRLGHFILRRSGYIYEDLSGRESGSFHNVSKYIMAVIVNLEYLIIVMEEFCTLSLN